MKKYFFKIMAMAVIFGLSQHGFAQQAEDKTKAKEEKAVMEKQQDDKLKKKDKKAAKEEKKQEAAQAVDPAAAKQ